jgi:hypothetical protein
MTTNPEDQYTDRPLFSTTIVIDGAETGPFTAWELGQMFRYLPTIHQGHYDNLKFDDGKTKVWVSRMTVDDGASGDHNIEIEQLIDGTWKVVATVWEKPRHLITGIDHDLLTP